jgi:acyl-CoA synthetase (NDP forming)
MSESSLDALFRARSIAVVGASEGLTSTGAPKMGTAALRHLLEHRYGGRIFPVNRRGGRLMGLEVCTSVRALPVPVDLALVLVPAAACLATIDDCVAAGVKSAVVFASGFAEAGEHGLQAELVRRARAGGMRLVGPNTAGIVNVGDDMVASISMACEIKPFRKGPIAFVTQSGALGGSMLARGMDDGIGFHSWVSTGNEADIELSEYVDYLLDQPEVRVIALFVEGVRDAKRFVATARKAARLGKPIVAYKTGRSEIAAAAAASHTGALAGSDRIFEAVCRQFGIVRVDDVAMLFPVAQTFARLGSKLPRGPRMAVISASGGICGVGADECARCGLDLPPLAEETKRRMGEFTPPFASLTNPIDVTGHIRSFATGYQDTVRAALAEPYVDGALLLVTMASEPRASFYGREIPALASQADKPIIVAWTGALSLAQIGYPMLAASDVPVFLSVRQAVEAMAALVRYQAFLTRFMGSAAETETAGS